jgi:hypothetical protein
MKGVLLAFTLLVVGCGSPSSFDLCNDSCNAQSRCSPGFSSTDLQNCQTACNQMKDTFSNDDATCDKQCTNCAAIRSSLASCLNKECSQIATCSQAVDQTCAIRQ